MTIDKIKYYQVRSLMDGSGSKKKKKKNLACKDEADMFLLEVPLAWIPVTIINTIEGRISARGVSTKKKRNFLEIKMQLLK